MFPKRKVKFVISKKKSSKKPVTASQVARIARNVSLRTAETKSFLGNYTQSAGSDNTVYAQNLIYPIAQGTASNQMIGEKFYLKNIALRGFVNIGNATTAATRCYRLLVIQTKKALVNTTGTITPSDVFRPSLAPGYAKVANVDLHKVNLLMDKTINVTPNLANQNAGRSFYMNVAINKTKTVDEDNTGYLKDGNYYFIVVCQDGSLGNPLGITMDFTINYKDE